MTNQQIKVMAEKIHTAWSNSPVHTEERFVGIVESALRQVHDEALEEAANVVFDKYWAAKAEDEPAENWLGNQIRALKLERKQG